MVIDRFEGEFAICQNADGKIMHIKRNKLPFDAKEGDVVIQDSCGVFILDKEKSTEILSSNKQRLSALLNRSKTSKAQNAKQKCTDGEQD